MPDPISRRDVFICFSKARPGEAQVALALKEQLEQIGLFAFEYEDWNWVADSVSGDEPDVDRRTLRHMLTACSVVVLISPHAGAASAGVQTEIAELRSCASPVILLHWSPEGWQPLFEPPELVGLNIVWSYEGRTSGNRGVAQNQCEHIARQLAVASWTACQVYWAAADHPRTAARVLAMIPEEPVEPLLNLRLVRPAVEPADWPEPADLDALAASVAAEASAEDLRAFMHQWRDGTDLLAAELADEAAFSLKRPVNTLYTALEALCQHAGDRRPELQELPGETLRRRGLMLTRLNRPKEALPVLQQALVTAAEDTRFEIHQALALAQQDSDPAGAVESLTRAIECSPTPEIACSITYTRGVLKAKASNLAAAIDDFTFVADHGTSATSRHSALRARAGLRADAGDPDGAIADFTQILADADSTPRTAVSAWMDRGALYHAQGRPADAIADWTRAIEAADAEPLQRFRSLEARARALEQLGKGRAAADDYESMTRYSSISPRYREELEREIARLRS